MNKKVVLSEYHKYHDSNVTCALWILLGRAPSAVSGEIAFKEYMDFNP